MLLFLMFRSHSSTHIREIAKNIYTYLLNKGLNASAAARNICQMTDYNNFTMNRINSHRTKKKCVDESDKGLIRRKVYIMFEELLVSTLGALKPMTKLK